MKAVSFAADRMPLRTGDEVMDGGGRTTRVVALVASAEEGEVVVCKDGKDSHAFCARLPHEVVHAPSWWQEAE